MAINRTPLLARPNAASGYTGLRVRWALEIKGASYDEGTKRARLHFGPSFFQFMTSEKHYVAVWGEVSLEDYPYLKVTPDKAKFWIHGTISDVTGFGINLGDVIIDRR